MKAVTLVATALLIVGCRPGAGTGTPTEASSAADLQRPAPAATPAPGADPALTAFLQERTADAMAPLGYVAREVGEGEQALTLVYLVGPEFCGSGGCKLLILRKTGGTYAVLGDTSVTRAPVRVLSTRTNGLPDIGVRVGGGGLINGYEARLKFDGSRYPSNPTVAPAERIEGAKGVILITDEDARTSLKS